MNSWANTALFLVMDTVPEYVRQTFDLTPEGRLVEEDVWGSSSMVTVHIGENIPSGLVFALVIYNSSMYHYRAARHLGEQIIALNPGCRVALVPVKG